MKKARGFHYVLEPVLLKANWEKERVERELSRVRNDLKLLQEEEKLIQEALDALTLSAVDSKEFHVDRLMVANRYMGELLRQLAEKRKEIAQVATALNEIRAKLADAVRRMDGMEKHRDLAQRDYVKEAQILAMKISDDQWMMLQAHKENHDSTA